MKNIVKTFFVALFLFINHFEIKAQDIDLKKTIGKWVISDITYNLAGKDGMPPSDEAMERWKTLQETKQDMIKGYNEQQFMVEITETGEGFLLTESYYSSLYGKSFKILYYPEYSPSGTYFSTLSKFGATKITPSLENGLLILDTGFDSNGMSISYKLKKK